MMEISGSLETMPMPELLQWLSLGGKTGVLTIENRQVRKVIFFTGGRIVSAASDDPREYFGQFLLRAKLITEGDLTEAFEEQKASGIMLGKILVDCDKLTEEDVRRQLVLKAEETILEVFLWKEGTFRFVDSELPTDNLIQISLDLLGLIAEGTRRLKELSALRERLPSTLTTFEVMWEMLPKDYEENRLMSDLVVMADDGRTVAEMCLELHENELSVFRMLKQLIDSGVTRPKEAQEIEAEALSEALVEELVREGEDLILIGRSAEAVGLLRRAFQISNSPEIPSLIEEATKLFKAELTPELMEKIPVLLQQPPREEITPEENFVLSRSNGSFTIDTLSKLAPFYSDEVLRIIKKYLDRGILKLEKPSAAWRDEDLPGRHRPV